MKALSEKTLALISVRTSSDRRELGSTIHRERKGCMI